MNDERIDNGGFDARARAAHARSLEALTPRVRAQLQQRRRAALAAPPPHPLHRRHGWAWLGAPALALVLAFGAPWRTAHDPVPAATVAAASVAAAGGTATAPATLEQDPDFYLWLASSDAVALASE